MSAERPFIADRPLRELRPLRDDRPFNDEKPKSWFGASTVLASSPQPISPTMAPIAMVTWMVRFPSSLIYFSP